MATPVPPGQRPNPIYVSSQSPSAGPELPPRLPAQNYILDEPILTERERKRCCRRQVFMEHERVVSLRQTLSVEEDSRSSGRRMRVERKGNTFASTPVSTYKLVTVSDG